MGNVYLCGCWACLANWEISSPSSQVFQGLTCPKTARWTSALSAVPLWFKASMMLSIRHNVQGCLDTWGLLSLVRDQNWKASRLGDLLILPNVLRDQVWISGPERPSLQADGKGRDPSRIKGKRDKQLEVSYQGMRKLGTDNKGNMVWGSLRQNLIR